MSQARSPDVCQTSIELLRDACLKALLKPGITAPVFADHQSFEAELRARGSGTRDIIFFGSCVRRFIESEWWPEGNYRFWVLSTPMQRVLAGLCGVPENKIGIIPRDLLFTPSSDPAPLPRIATEPCTFVFGGRLSSVKNLEFLLRTVSSLQTDFDSPVRLALFGDADDDYPADRGRSNRNKEPYLQSLTKLASWLPWNYPPVFHEKQGANQWLQAPIDRPVFLSLSSFFMEDFGVALAQSQTLGWPAIISNWGGHRDAAGLNLMKIPMPLLGCSHEPVLVQELKAKNLASILVQGPTRSTFDHVSQADHQLVLPDPISKLEITSLRQAFLEKMGQDSRLMHRDFPEYFADTPSGRRFFKAYRGLFSGIPNEAFTAVLVDDFSENDSALAFCNELLRRTHLSKNACCFIDFSEISEAYNRGALLQAKSVILPFLSDRMVSFLNEWLASNPEPPLRIAIGDNKKAPLITKLRKNKDQVIPYSEFSL